MTADLLVATRAELGRRGAAPWAGVLQRFEQEVGEVPAPPAGADLGTLLRQLTGRQRAAVRRLLMTLAGEPERPGRCPCGTCANS